MASLLHQGVLLSLQRAPHMHTDRPILSRRTHAQAPLQALHCRARTLPRVRNEKVSDWVG